MIRATSTPWESAVRPGARIGHAIEIHDVIGSTNDRARELLEAGAPDGAVVVAELQTEGRGRRGRTWSSPSGVNLTASIALRPRLAAGAARGLVPAAALGALGACRTAGDGVWLKWPNDLVTDDGAKLGGILVEVASEGDALRHAVIGVGLNVNWPRAEMPSELRDAAASLSELAGRPLDRVGLLGALLAALETEVEALEAGRSPVPRFRDACRTVGADVAVDTPAGRVTGRAMDLDGDGALVVATHGGRVTIGSGEVLAVRPVVTS